MKLRILVAWKVAPRLASANLLAAARLMPPASAASLPSVFVFDEAALRSPFAVQSLLLMVMTATTPGSGSAAVDVPLLMEMIGAAAGDTRGGKTRSGGNGGCSTVPVRGTLPGAIAVGTPDRGSEKRAACAAYGGEVGGDGGGGDGGGGGCRGRGCRRETQPNG